MEIKAKKFTEQRKIILEFEDGLNPKYKQWTREAVIEFLDLFPAQKRFFNIEECVTNCFIEKVFEKYQKGGNLRTIDDFHTYYCVADEFNHIHHKIGVLNSRIDSMYGFGGSNCAVICATNIGLNKQMFKNLVKHELGHSFHAAERANGVDGNHCANMHCIMSLAAYSSNAHDENGGNFDFNKLFCEDCMRDMSKYVQDLYQNSNIRPKKKFEFKIKPKSPFTMMQIKKINDGRES